jgi:UPF0716 protein FxsA
VTGLIVLGIVILLLSAEIAVFALVGDAIGVLLTIIGVFVTAAIGIRLFRHLGQGTLRRMAEASEQGKAPVVEVADGIAIMIAAGLLLIPGYVTDAGGLIFFIPKLRVLLVVVVLGSLLNRLSASHFAFTAATHHAESAQSAEEQDATKITIEGEFERKD